MGFFFSLVVDSEGTSLVGIHELLIAVTFLVAEHRFQGAQALVVIPRLQSTGSIVVAHGFLLL